MNCAGATDCNCFIFQRKNTPMWFVPRTQLRLLTPPEAMRGYTFNKHAIQHQFCPTGGMHLLGEGTDPEGDAMAAVNIRCLEGWMFMRCRCTATTEGRCRRGVLDFGAI